MPQLQDYIHKVTYLGFFKSPDSVFLALVTLSLHGVGPVLDTALGGSLQVSSVLVPHGLVGILLSLDNLSSNAIEVIDGDDGSTLLLLSVTGSSGVDSARVG